MNAAVNANSEVKYQGNKLEVGTSEETPRIRKNKPVIMAKVLGGLDGKGKETAGCATDPNNSLKCIALSYPAPRTHNCVSNLINATIAIIANPDTTKAMYLTEESNLMFGSLTRKRRTRKPYPTEEINQF